MKPWLALHSSNVTTGLGMQTRACPRQPMPMHQDAIKMHGRTAGCLTPFSWDGGVVSPNADATRACSRSFFSRDRHILHTRSQLPSHATPHHSSPQVEVEGCLPRPLLHSHALRARHNFSKQRMMDLLLRVIVDNNRREPPKFPDGEGWLFPRHYCVTRWRRPWPVPLLLVLIRCADVSSYLRPPILLDRAQFS